MEIEVFDYDLPEALIAQQPPAERGDSRMLVLAGSRIEDRHFRDLPEMLRPGDLLVLNDSRVFPARVREHDAELLFLRPLDGAGLWEALCKPARRFAPGTTHCVKGIEVTVEAPRGEFGKRRLRVADGIDLMSALQQCGEPPLPPYIHRNGDAGQRDVDVDRYQTVFAKATGSAAAPTAGLHFSEAMLRVLEARAEVARVTLHVSNATFQPIRTKQIEDHRMDPEFCEISAEAARAIEEGRARARRGAGRVIAVGTTAVRTLESAAAAAADGRIRGGTGCASLYITPGYEFRVVDALLTNFHQPRTTLLVLVSAFCGIETIRSAYSHALAGGYRFLSYGDCMFADPGARRV